MIGGTCPRGSSPPDPASASLTEGRMLYTRCAGRAFFSERQTRSYSIVSAEASTPVHERRPEIRRERADFEPHQ